MSDHTEEAANQNNYTVWKHMYLFYASTLIHHSTTVLIKCNQLNIIDIFQRQNMGGLTDAAHVGVIL